MPDAKEVLEYLENKKAMERSKQECKCGGNCKDKIMTKDEFYALLEDCIKEFPDIWNKKFPTDRLDFEREAPIREYVEHVKRKIFST